MTKHKFSISIDSDVYEAAKAKYPKLSPRINELLAMDVYGSDEKDQLLQELHQLKLREKTITKKICELEKQEVKMEAEKSNLDAVLSWVQEVYLRNGVIGLNQLGRECKSHKVSFDEVKQILDNEGIAYVNFTG